MTDLPVKKHIIRGLKIGEISSVDRPAQTGAVAILMKRADDADESDICKNAAAVAEGEAPSYGVTAYEDAMFRRAGELAHYYRITPEQALVKGLADDKPLKDLAHAAEIARHNGYAGEVRKRNGARA